MKSSTRKVKGATAANGLPAAVNDETGKVTGAPEPAAAFPSFNFDGCGINGRDQYRERLATLTKEGHRLQVGPLFAAAPELLAYAKFEAETMSGKGFTEAEYKERAGIAYQMRRAAIARAEAR